MAKKDFAATLAARTANKTSDAIDRDYNAMFGREVDYRVTGSGRTKILMLTIY